VISIKRQPTRAFHPNALPAGDEYAYWRSKLPTSLVVLSDQDFTEFTINSTEIVTRVRIDSARKTVERGALWTQEALPSDTLLMSSVNVSDSRNGNKMSAIDLTQWLGDSVPARIQIGGDETTGQGFVALRWWWVG
jgi:CRISPR-associated protein Cmr4